MYWLWDVSSHFDKFSVMTEDQQHQQPCYWRIFPEYSGHNNFLFSFNVSVASGVQFPFWFLVLCWTWTWSDTTFQWSLQYMNGYAYGHGLRKLFSWHGRFDLTHQTPWKITVTLYGLWKGHCVLKCISPAHNLGQEKLCGEYVCHWCFLLLLKGLRHHRSMLYHEWNNPAAPPMAVFFKVWAIELD